jgi:serine/threonine protein kinase
LAGRTRTGATGTLEFMAPELIAVDDHGRYLPNFSPKADMWSLGLLFYFLCYSRLPYHNLDDVTELKKEILEFEG